MGDLESNINCVFYPCDLDYESDSKIILNPDNEYGTFNYFMNNILFWIVMTIVPYFAVLEIFKKLKLKYVPNTNSSIRASARSSAFIIPCEIRFSAFSLNSL